jgi:hypothetical protein
MSLTASLTKTQLELENLKVENSLLLQSKLCLMCMGPSTCKYEYAEQLKECQLQLKLANEIIQRLVNRDYAQKELDRCKDNIYAIRRLKLKEHLNTLLFYKPMFPPMVKMVTITFDRSRFKHLNSRSSQRDYILYALGRRTEMNDFIGCFELQNDGVVHAHLIIINISEETTYKLSSYFTNKIDNPYAVHVCDKSYEDAYNYITKEETKDPNELFNYFYK